MYLLLLKVLIAQSVQRLATACAVWGSNTGWGEIPFTRPNRFWAHLAPFALGTGSLFGGTAAGHGVDHLSQFSAEVKEKV